MRFTGMFVADFRGRILFHVDRDPAGSHAVLKAEVF
jgi:hypothetical protein